MRNSIHPYAIIFGVGIGIMVLYTLRHPLFAIFAGVLATVTVDFGIKQVRGRKDE